jgi:hypothetical protein
MELAGKIHGPKLKTTAFCVQFTSMVSGIGRRLQRLSDYLVLVRNAVKDGIGA